VIIQKHHIQYKHPEHKSQDDVVVYIGKGEHQILTKMQWYTSKNLSSGFIRALKIFIALNEDRATNYKEDYFGNKKIKS